MELLIVIVIGSIVTGGILMIWFSISRSSAMTTSHAEARDFARDGIARLSREIRDAEAVPGKQAVQQARPNSIAFTTTFNVTGSEFDTTKPRLVRYVYDDVAGCLYRDTYADGATYLDPYARRDIVIPHMLNDGAGLFNYTYVPSDGGSPLPAPEVTDPGNLSRILLVRIHVIVDLDPGKAPNGMDITTQVQVRNQRILD